MRERVHDHVPAPADLAHHVLEGNAHAVEEHLVEPVLARHLLQRPDLDPGRLHVDQQEGDAVVLAPGVGIGAHDQDAPIGVLREAGPDLLTGDDDRVFFDLAARAQRREVGAGARLGEALTPDVLARQDLAQEGLALPILPLRDQHRAGQADADAQTDEIGSPGARVLLAPDHLLEDPELASAVGARPGQPGPAALEEPALPPAGEAHPFRRAVGPAVAGRPPSRGQVLLEPAAHLQPEARVLGALAKVHGGGAR